jgi:hypothetical protein
VMGQTIKDSLGAYCTEGQEAALNAKDAKHYYKLKLVQAAMPDFDKKETDGASRPANTSRTKTTADAGPNQGQVKP